MGKAIAVGDDATWPEDLQSLFADNFEALASYEREECRIEETKYTPGGWGGIRRPSNPFLDVHESVLARADVLGTGIPLIGHHATRLAPDEIAGILRDGMAPLALAQVERRLRARVAAGDLSKELADYFLTKNFANDRDSGNRLGMIWFVLDGGLDSESGVSELFGFWGGESLYHAHAENREARAVLASIGTPCIVEAELSSDSVETYSSVGQRLLNSYLLRRDASPDGGWESPVRTPIPGAAIRRIMRLGDPAFES